MKTAVLLVLIVLLVLPCSVFGVSYVDLERTTIGEMELDFPENWLSGWGQRVKLTIDNNDVDDSLSDFPTLIYLSNSSGRNNEDISFVFDELQSDNNRKKIAVTTSDGETECYVEVEKWDDANEQAWLWTKTPTVSNTSDTDLYLYYDDTQSDNTNYVGDTNSSPAENVWNDNFKLVTHMRDNPDTSHVRDSTSFNNDGTKKGANEPQVVTTGQIDDAQYFDGVDDLVSIPYNSVFDMQNFTIELWIYTPTEYTGSDWEILLGKTSHWFVPFAITWTTHTTDKLKAVFAIWDSGGTRHGLDIYNIPVATWVHAIFVYDGVDMIAYMNLVETSTPYTGDVRTNTNGFHIYKHYLGSNHYDSTLDEFRISDVARSSAWIKACYETQRDDLIDFGSEDSGVLQYPTNIVVTDLESSYEVKLYNSTGGLVTNATANSEGTANMTLGSEYRSSAFEGTFRVYDTNSSFLYSKWYEDVHGGDTYEIKQETSKGFVLAVGVLALFIGVPLFALIWRGKR